MAELAKGVSSKVKTFGGAITLIWRDPRQEGRQRKSSAGTAEPGEALRIAKSLSRLIYEPEIRSDPPDDIHSTARIIFGAMGATEPAKKAAGKLARLELDRAIAAVIGEGKNLANVQRAAAAAFEGKVIIRRKTKGTGSPGDIIELTEKYEDMRRDRDNWRDYSRLLEGQLADKGKRYRAQTDFKKLKDAVDEFVAEYYPHNISKPWNDRVANTLRKMSREIGDDKDVFKIEETDVKKWLQGLDVCNSRLQSVVTYALKFLRKATMNRFDDQQTLRGEVLDNLDDDSGEWVWLTQEESTSLIAKIKEKDGDFFADAATLQYACGFRAEEIVLLRTDNVVRRMEDGKEKFFIWIKPIIQKNVVVRSLKLKKNKAEGLIEVPSFAHDALKRRMACKQFLLFPLMDENLVPSWAWLDDGKNARTDFERQAKLWPKVYGFSEAYRPRLRAAALAAKIVKAVDSRTFRRTCARELVIEHGYERAAAVLRDSVETLRSHYADLEAKDVSTERTRSTENKEA